MCLGPEKLTISKLDNIKLTEITRTTGSNINSGFKFRVRSNSKQEQSLNKNRK
jgi:hypothetical protein